MRIPFPYWLWQEIVLTDPPHNKATLFRLLTGVMSLGGGTAGFLLGRTKWGWLWALLPATALFIVGAIASFFVFRGTEKLLRMLVRWKLVTEPNFGRTDHENPQQPAP